MTITTKQSFHCLNRCVLNINGTLGIKFYCNMYQNANQCLYQENAFENVMKTVQIMRRYSHLAPKAKSLIYLSINLCLSFFLLVSPIWKGTPWIITSCDTLVQSRPGCTGNGNWHLGRKLTMICARSWGDLDLRSLALKKKRSFKIKVALGYGKIFKGLRSLCIFVQLVCKFIRRLNNIALELHTHCKRGHYRTQCWSSSLTHTYDTRARWVNEWFSQEALKKILSVPRALKTSRCIKIISFNVWVR